MKTLLGVVSALALLVSAAPAVTWDIVAVSVVVKQGSTSGNIVTTVLNARKYLDLAASRSGTPRSDLFIGFREDNGEISVVKKSTETVLYRIVSGLTPAGLASNGTGTKQSIAVTATVSSLNTDFPGFALDTVTLKPNGTIKTLTRQVVGGFQNQTIKGTFVTTGRRINL